MIAAIGIKLMHRLSPRMPLLITIMYHYLCMHTVRKNFSEFAILYSSNKINVQEVVALNEATSDCKLTSPRTVHMVFIPLHASDQ
jgi:hypothetical protein